MMCGWSSFMPHGVDTAKSKWGFSLTIQFLLVLLLCNALNPLKEDLFCISGMSEAGFSARCFNKKCLGFSCSRHLMVLWPHSSLAVEFLVTGENKIYKVY